MPEDNLVGGPADGSDPSAAPPAKQPATAPPAEQRVEVTYGGKTFKVSPEAASVINQAKADTDAAKAAADRARAPVIPPPAAPPAKTPAIPADLMITDPDKYTEMVIAEAEKRASVKMAASYQRDQFERDFWGAFDTQNPDLKDERRLARSIYTEQVAQWTREGLTGEQALAKLGDMTRTEVTRIMTKGGKAPKKPQARTEGPSDGARGGEPAAKDDDGDAGTQPYSTKNILAERRKMREAPTRSDTKH